MWPFSRKPIVPVLRLSGPIGMVSPSAAGPVAVGAWPAPIERAFTMSKLPSVAIVINSPGGSPVQSSLMFKRIRQLAEENKKKVYVFCEDVAASGGYYLAVAGDEIYADASSIVGSIGVIFASFGLDKAIAKLGIERRVYTAGTNKSQLDAFLPENARGRRADQGGAARRPRRVHRRRQGSPRRQAAGARSASCSPARSGRRRKRSISA